jgi:hypothetical protein
MLCYLYSVGFYSFFLAMPCLKLSKRTNKIEKNKTFSVAKAKWSFKQWAEENNKIYVLSRFCSSFTFCVRLFRWKWKALCNVCVSNSMLSRFTFEYISMGNNPSICIFTTCDVYHCHQHQHPHQLEIKS